MLRCYKLVWRCLKIEVGIFLSQGHLGNVSNQQPLQDRMILESSSATCRLANYLSTEVQGLTLALLRWCCPTIISASGLELLLHDFFSVLDLSPHLPQVVDKNLIQLLGSLCFQPTSQELWGRSRFKAAQSSQILWPDYLVARVAQRSNHILLNVLGGNLRPDDSYQAFWHLGMKVIEKIMTITANVVESTDHFIYNLINYIVVKKCISSSIENICSNILDIVIIYICVCMFECVFV